MNEPQSEPISRYLCYAFYGAVQHYPNWTGLDHGPLVSVEGRPYTIGEVCNLTAIRRRRPAMPPTGTARPFWRGRDLAHAS